MVPSRMSTWCFTLALWAGAAPAQDAAATLRALPHFDFSSLAASAKQELVAVLSDEFDYCGRPLTLLAALSRADACAHTRRLVSHAAAQLAEGASANEVILALSKYNQSFNRPRAKLPIDERACRGAKDASVTLLVFSDFECPACAGARPALEALASTRPDARLCWAPFPLSQHPHSALTAQAALFARNEGKFWATHDALFERQASLTEATVFQVLAKVGLDTKAFEKAMASGGLLSDLDATKQAARRAGVDSTPSVFVNGRKLTLGVSAATLALSVDDELDWQAGRQTWLPKN